MVRRTMITCLALCTILSLRAAAQETQPQPQAAEVGAQPTSQPVDLQKQNEELRTQMQQMQARMDALEKNLNDKLDKANYQAETRAVLKQMLAEQPPPEQWVTTVAQKTKLQIYGFLRGEVSHDTRLTNGGYLAFFTLKDNPATGKRSDTNITARNTRLGFNFTFPEYNGIQTSGKLETDFGTPAQVDTAELSPNIRMRQAYVQAKACDTTFLAGQTWDVFAPLNPTTDNVGILWDSGNIGYRHPQFRVEHEFKCDATNKFLGQFALSRAVGGDSAINGDIPDGQDDGSAANWPDLQARLAYTTKLLTEKPTTFGISGIYGPRLVRAIPAAIPPPPHSDLESEYSALGLAGDFTLPLTEKLDLRGEGYVGRGLGGYYGNIGQYFDPGHQEPVQGGGGWWELDYQLCKQMVIRGGWGADCVDPDRLSASTQRDFNMIPFINYSYFITPYLTWTVEYEYIRTRYFESGAFDDNRVSTSVTLSF